MKTSVAMCTYNGEAFIRQQLDSIFAQTKLPDEIVVCDDVSRDNTVAILNQYANQGVELRIYRNEENLGFVKNFRKCLSLCTGDIIILCDQDDIWEENKAEELVRLMEETPGMLSVCSNFRYIDTSGEFLGKSKSGDNKFYNKKKWEFYQKNGDLYHVTLSRILGGNIAPGATQAIRNVLLEEYFRWDTQEPHDFVLNRAAAIHNGLFYYDKPLTQYRIHEHQTLGVSSYLLAKCRGDYKTILENYFNVFRVFVYHTILKQYDKVGEFPRFGYQKELACYDAIAFSGELKAEYLQWREMVINRTLLYTSSSHKWKYFIKQGKYNKYLAHNYGMIELLQMRVWDLTALILK